MAITVKIGSCPLRAVSLTALDVLHDRGALHNDVHSKNVLFRRDRRGPWKDPPFFPLHGPSLFTFKIGDFGQASSWFRSDEGDERDDLIVGDIRMAAYVLVDVAFGRHEVDYQPATLSRAAGKYAEPIQAGS